MENIKQLREQTGAGIVDCKKALEESGGDITKAIEILRKQGIAKAAKRSEREANQGVIKVATNEQGNEGYIVEVNAETDFVVRNEQFQQFADLILQIIEWEKPKDLNELINIKFSDVMASKLSETPLHPNETVKERLDNLSGVIGEKLDIKRCNILSGSIVAAYSHMGGKIGVLVALDKEGEQELAHDIAMQIAAANPKYITPEDVSAEEIQKEKEIYREQLKKEGKPDNIIDKILEGKINKYFEEVCLVKQEYIKDDKKRIEDVLGDVKVEKFVRYSL